MGVFGCYFYHGGWQLLLLVSVAGVSGRSANRKPRVWKDEQLNEFFF